MPKTLTTAQDFIDFFTPIPDEKWCTGYFEHGVTKQRCATGLVRENPFVEDANSTKLRALFDEENIDVSWINNGSVPIYYQATPKARILAALHDLKEKGK